MDLKRWLMALALAALLTAPIGSSTTALAAGGQPTLAGLAYHDQPSDEGEDGGEDEGDEEGGGDERRGGLPGLISALIRALAGEGED